MPCIGDETDVRALHRGSPNLMAIVIWCVLSSFLSVNDPFFPFLFIHREIRTNCGSFVSLQSLEIRTYLVKAKNAPRERERGARKEEGGEGKGGKGKGGATQRHR